jgi:redox-sensitive bicupin YhaK (pirin superfamily)
MKQRKVSRVVTGRPGRDGAGVNLVRVLSTPTIVDFDPFLMLDSFDSRNPADYTNGFPMHPHRGIETITYLVEGQIDHEDSLGNNGVISDGSSQWMTAGSGIMHQEMPKTQPRMLGFQLWLNLPAKDKMTEPKYFDIQPENIPTVVEDGRVVRIISGEYAGVSGVKPHHIQATLMDISLEAGRSIDIPVPADETVFLFLMEGGALVDGQSYAEKSALLMSDGDTVSVTAPEGTNSRFQVVAGSPLHEPVAWGGPIVMNTEAELEQAFRDLRYGSFIRQNPSA